MERLRNKLIYGLAGMFTGLVGMVSVANCSGGCSNCYRCAGTGLGIIILAALSGYGKPGRGSKG